MKASDLASLVKQLKIESGASREKILIDLGLNDKTFVWGVRGHREFTYIGNDQQLVLVTKIVEPIIESNIDTLLQAQEYDVDKRSVSGMKNYTAVEFYRNGKLIATSQQ